MNDELRQNRLQGMKLRLKQAIINNRSIYLSTWGLQNPFATKEEIDAIVTELVVTGFCALIKGRNGGDKLMTHGDESRREQAVSNA
jgi:hypothetical protein